MFCFEEEMKKVTLRSLLRLNLSDRINVGRHLVGKLKTLLDVTCVTLRNFR